MKKNLLLLSLPAIAICAFSCWGFTKQPYPYPQPEKRWAWKPVYALDTSYRIISYKKAQPVINAGKIYVKDNFIYQCEVGAGIHVTDNSDPETAKRIGFIEVPGCEEISIKGKYLYTNNYYDLITVDISSLHNLQIVNRVKNAFHAISGSPHSWEQPKDSGWFQCPETFSDSVVVDWIKDSVIAYCYK